MRRPHRLALAFALGVLGAAAPSSPAYASLGTVTMAGGVTPVSVTGTTAPSPVSLSFGFDATYPGGFNPPPSAAVFHFDNDIAFDATGIFPCSPASIVGKTTAQALLTCGKGKVGAGTTAYNSGALNGVITAFNGTPSGGHPTILFHVDINSGALILVLVGDIVPSSRGGDYGTQISVPSWPNTPGVVPTHWAVTLDNAELTPGHHYVSASCSDADGVLNFASDFTYYDSSTRTASATQSCGATGERAAALKKCKKKHTKKARKKCRKKAAQLPV